MSKWIRFLGEGCPVPHDAVVEIFALREIGEPYNNTSRMAGDWDWSIEGVPGDIIAYRVVEADDGGNQED